MFRVNYKRTKTKNTDTYYKRNYLRYPIIPHALDYLPRRITRVVAPSAEMVP